METSGHPLAVEVVELSERDSIFGPLEQADPSDTQPAELTLAPLDAEPKTFAAEVQRAFGRTTGHSRYDDLMFGTADGQVKP